MFISFVENRLLPPTLVFVVSPFGHSRPAFDEADGFDGASGAGAARVPADALDPKDIDSGIGPKVEQREEHFTSFVCTEIEPLSDRHAIQKSLVEPAVHRTLPVDRHPQWLFRFDLDRESQLMRTVVFEGNKVSIPIIQLRD